MDRPITLVAVAHCRRQKPIGSYHRKGVFRSSTCSRAENLHTTLCCSKRCLLKIGRNVLHFIGASFASYGKPLDNCLCYTRSARRGCGRKGRGKRNSQLWMNRKTLLEVHQFKYLGSTQTKNGTSIMEVNIRPDWHKHSQP